jgi:hypothetical protein
MEMATMTDYPAGPTDVPPDLTQPSPAYRRHAYLAVAGLAVFIAAYLGLTAWFAWAAVRMWRQIGVTGNGWWWVGAAATAFLALFMVKALVFVRRGGGGAKRSRSPPRAIRGCTRSCCRSRPTPRRRGRTGCSCRRRSTPRCSTT